MKKLTIISIILIGVLAQNPAFSEQNFQKFKTDLVGCLEKQKGNCILQFIQKNSLTTKGKFRCRKEDQYLFNSKELVRCLEKENGELKLTIQSCLEYLKPSSDETLIFIREPQWSSTCIFQKLNDHWSLAQVLAPEE